MWLCDMVRKITEIVSGSRLVSGCSYISQEENLGLWVLVGCSYIQDKKEHDVVTTLRGKREIMRRKIEGTTRDIG